MTIREFAKLNNFPIRGKLTRIPDEVEYDFNDRPHSCKRYVDEDFNEYGIHEDGFIVAIPCEKAWGFSTKEKSRIAAMIEKSAWKPVSGAAPMNGKGVDYENENFRCSRFPPAFGRKAGQPMGIRPDLHQR